MWYLGRELPGTVASDKQLSPPHPANTQQVMGFSSSSFQTLVTEAEELHSTVHIYCIPRLVLTSLFELVISALSGTV